MKLILPSDSPVRAPGFIFGVASSALQIEGAADKRLSSIWDTFCENPGKIADGSDCSIACDHYHRWQEDVDLIASFGVDAYRLSICWPRVIEEDGSVNQAGIEFYVRLLDRLNSKGVKPFVTLYHWELPQHLEDRAGWLNRDTAYRFCDYVEVVTKAFGDRVYSYATLNEPFCSAYLGYETGVHAPGHVNKTFGKKAAHNLLLAHGLAMQILDQNSPSSDNGIVLNLSPRYGATDSVEDWAAAKAADEIHNQWYVKPLLDGRYPDLIDDLPGDELPDIRQGDLEVIAHPLDFLGVNYYTRVIYRADTTEPFVEVEPTARTTEMGWEIYPQGLTDLLVTLDKRYKLPPIYVAENGAAFADKLKNGEVEDTERLEYLQLHLDAVGDAMDQGVDVVGYFWWTLMDNFEWAEGYAKRFGLVFVDFETQERIVKASGYAYRDFLKERRPLREQVSRA